MSIFIGVTSHLAYDNFSGENLRKNNFFSLFRYFELKVDTYNIGMLFKVSLLMVFLVLSTLNADSNISKDGESSEGKKSLMDGLAKFFTDEKYMGISPQELENRIRKSLSSKTKSNRKFFVFFISIRF